MNLKQILTQVTNKSNFETLSNYLIFSKLYLEYITTNLQAVIVSQNENHYQFYQYKQEGDFQITRPINGNLMYSLVDFLKIEKDFTNILKNTKSLNIRHIAEREMLNKMVYTLQQSIGVALDALPSGQSNTTRKLNGDLFENLIRLIIREIGINCRSGVVQIPVVIDNEPAFKMSYQHDLIIEQNNDLKLLGSVKTSSKDRIDKIFIDKFLYNRLTETQIPHIAIFLNDVQRKNAKNENEYGINSTFLPGHFKGYTVKLNPLDGVYYCDIRPNMQKESILKDHIKTFDCLICEDIWQFLI